MRLGAGLFLDLGRVKQRGDDRGRADADGDASLHQLGTALFVGAIQIVVAVAHARFSMAFRAAWEAA
jgi:hypothetical protein